MEQTINMDDFITPQKFKSLSCDMLDAYKKMESLDHMATKYTEQAKKVLTDNVDKINEEIEAKANKKAKTIKTIPRLLIVIIIFAALFISVNISSGMVFIILDLVVFGWVCYLIIRKIVSILLSKTNNSKECQLFFNKYKYITKLKNGKFKERLEKAKLQDKKATEEAHEEAKKELQNIKNKHNALKRDCDYYQPLYLAWSRKAYFAKSCGIPYLPNDDIEIMRQMIEKIPNLVHDLEIPKKIMDDAYWAYDRSKRDCEYYAGQIHNLLSDILK